MELTSSQTDALTELISIGYARAAAALSELSGHRISLEVPEVAIHVISEITEKLRGVVEGEVVSINQVFSGPISGNAILILDRKAALLLNALLTDRPDQPELDGAAREVMTEVGNIVLNACLGAFGNLLKVQVTFTVPSIQIESVPKVIRSITIADKKLGVRVDHTHPVSHAGERCERLPRHYPGADFAGNPAAGVKEMGGSGTSLTAGPGAKPADISEANRDRALLTWIQQFAPYGVITLDTSLAVQSWNHWMEVHSALTLADVAGKNFFALFPDSNERKLAAYFERALKGESSLLSTSLPSLSGAAAPGVPREKRGKHAANGADCAAALRGQGVGDRDRDRGRDPAGNPGVDARGRSIGAMKFCPGRWRIF